MAAAVLQFVRSLGRWLRPPSITGPIFAKELRTSSRRRRNYVLRGVYLLVLTAVLVLVWLATVYSGSGASGVYAVTRHAEAGKAIIGSLAWFQFLAAQVVAVILLSNAVSDEIYHRTLAVLMSTPVRPRQIIAGKLASKLLQLVILLAVSVPVLAVVRVFGGVPWDFVLCSLCLTLSAAVLAGSVSLFFSIVLRRAWASILVTLGAGFVGLVLLPWMLGFLLISSGEEPWGFMEFLLHTNPFFAMGLATAALSDPSVMVGAPFSFYWPLNCAITLGLSFGVLGVCVLLLRRVGLKQAVGDSGVVGGGPFPPGPPAMAWAGGAGGPAPVVAGAAIDAAPIMAVPAPVPLRAASAPAGAKVRRISGSPLIWRELRQPLTRSTVKKVLAVVIPLVILAAMYAAWWGQDGLDDDESHIFFVVVYLIAGILFTSVLAATAVTTEKETSSWPLLLSTPVGSGHIAAAKAAGVFRRSLPVWAVLAAHALTAALAGVLHPVAVIQLGLIAGYVVVFVTGLGLFLSALLRRSTAAVLTVLGIIATLWGLSHLLLGLAAEIPFEGRQGVQTAFEFSVACNPVAQAVIVADAAAGDYEAGRRTAELDYDGPEPFDDLNGDTATVLVGQYALAYSALGVLLAWLAAVRLRRRIY